jgi:hypothetical protein
MVQLVHSDKVQGKMIEWCKVIADKLCPIVSNFRGASRKIKAYPVTKLSLGFDDHAIARAYAWCVIK